MFAKIRDEKFGGDPVVWPEFYETFKVSVHENGDLSDVERFSYLKHYVFGEAASCIQGLPLSSDNYSDRVFLCEKFSGGGGLNLGSQRSLEGMVPTPCKRA